MTTTIDAARRIQRQQVNPEPVGNDCLQDFRQLFAEEFPEPQCEAQKAIEGTSHQRVESNRFAEDAA